MVRPRLVQELTATGAIAATDGQMDVATFTYRPDAGWSVSAFPDWDSPATLVLAFAAPEYRDQPAALHALARAYPASHLLGCSTAGEIAGTALLDGSLSVAVVRFTATTLRTAAVPITTAADSAAVGEALGQALAGPALSGVFVLSDGHIVNGSALVRGLNAVLPPEVVVTGGLAGDGPRFERTWVIDRGEPREGFVTAVGFYGEQVRLGHGSKGGWDIFGPERRVTRAEGNVLYELDGRPALELYTRYLGERAAELPASALLFPLAVRTGPDDDQPVVRTILSVDEAAQALIFAGDVPEGSLAQLMRANFDRLVDGAGGAALTARGDGELAAPGLCIAISCVGRRLVLGERTEEELEATLDALPPGTRQAGFYSYGEISPYASGRCDLHNQTMTLTMLHER